jgi:hypothetical protein
MKLVKGVLLAFIKTVLLVINIRKYTEDNDVYD